MEWTLNERIKHLEDIFDELQMTNSLTDKQAIIKYNIPEDLKDDFMYIVECLNGKHKFGYKYYFIQGTYFDPKIIEDEWTIKNLLQYLQTPMMDKDLTEANIYNYVYETQYYREFLEPIVNRTLKLGIGNSLFEKTKVSPMLAKKFEGDAPNSTQGYYITEKLDGNRCIASYDFEKEKWVFTSRNGKEMKVNFNMGSLPKNKIFDGEVLSRKQVEMSNCIYNFIVNKTVEGFKKFENEFNSTSGLINSLSTNKDLVYNIFDYISDEPYINRRSTLLIICLDDNIVSHDMVSNNVRILPILKHYKNKEHLNNNIYDLLHKVTALGGEGVMINIGDAKYEQKRTDKLLKLKEVQTMDMKVVDINDGTGKYEGLVGSIHCEILTDDGKFISCDVGSGLSDEQRYKWASQPWEIIGKIVEVAYFSISQNKTSYDYSLRFPRLINIRDDKSETSEF